MRFIPRPGCAPAHGAVDERGINTLAAVSGSGEPVKWPSVLFLIGTSAGAQFAEPILTRSALPNPAGTVSLKLDFVNSAGGTSAPSGQAVPEAFVEVGLGRGFETVLQWPVLRVSEPGGASVLAGGQFSVALRYLLAGSANGRYAISVAGRLEVPTGDSAIVGNETQLMPAVLAEWHATPRLWLRSNVGWDTTVSGTTGRFAYLEDANAIVWRANPRFMPVLESVGSTNTLTGNTQRILQPEVIIAPSRRLELKAGFAVGLVAVRGYAIRSQLAWIWGRRE